MIGLCRFAYNAHDVCDTNMWCDLGKPFAWCKISIESWYHVKVWIVLFSELFTWIFCDTGVKSYWCSKAKNIRIMLLITFILQLHPQRNVTGFPRSAIQAEKTQFVRWLLTMLVKMREIWTCSLKLSYSSDLLTGMEVFIYIVVK